ncbi:hypothetical protein G4B88_025185 [Cannabis sativa]|uniref:Uncharacterized protein n=1 Tax=Cannabis sativa TaxID=3483 RepID=A0A7J6FZC4_CANSA|nr:hypothetical protein G4B88_025185 [Cannabis sativa]
MVIKDEEEREGKIVPKMVAISLYRGNLHRVPDVPRRWLMPTPQISLKDFKLLLSRRSKALSRLHSPTTATTNATTNATATSSNPNPSPNPNPNPKPSPNPNLNINLNLSSDQQNTASNGAPGDSLPEAQVNLEKVSVDLGEGPSDEIKVEVNPNLDGSSEKPTEGPDTLSGPKSNEPEGGCDPIDEDGAKPEPIQVEKVDDGSKTEEIQVEKVDDGVKPEEIQVEKVDDGAKPQEIQVEKVDDGAQPQEIRVVKVDEVAEPISETKKNEDMPNDKLNRKKEVEEKLEVLNNKKHNLVQVLKQILNAEEELKRRISLQGSGTPSRPAAPLQVDVNNDSVSMTRNVVSRTGSEPNNSGEAEAGETDAFSNHNFPTRQISRMNSISPSSESPIRRPPFVQHNVAPYSTPRTSLGPTSSPSPSRFSPIVHQGPPTNLPTLSVTGTNYIASSPSPAASGGTSAFKDSRLPSPWY